MFIRNIIAETLTRKKINYSLEFQVLHRGQCTILAFTWNSELIWTMTPIIIYDAFGPIYNRTIHLILIILQIIFFISLFVREIVILTANGGSSIIDSPGWTVPFELAGILTSLMWLFCWYLRGADEKVRKSVRASLITIVIELVADMIMCLLSFSRMPFYWISGIDTVVGHIVYSSLTILFAVTIYKLLVALIAPRRTESEQDAWIKVVTGEYLRDQGVEMNRGDTLPKH